MSGHSVLAGTDQTDDNSGVFRRVKRLVIHPRFSVGPYWLDNDEYGFKQVRTSSIQEFCKYIFLKLKYLRVGMITETLELKKYKGIVERGSVYAQVYY